MKKRKHRIMVEVTFDRPVDGRYAIATIQNLLDLADWQKLLGEFPADIIKTEAKNGERVIQQEVRKVLESRVVS